MAQTEHAAEHHDAGHHHEHPPSGMWRWLSTTNHKDIGTLYLIFSCIMFFVGGSFAMLIRAELFKPGLQFLDPALFNTMTTMHALVMIFGAIMPAFVGLANWMIPMQLGAPDMALPRMNNFSFWILPFAFTLLLGTYFVPGGALAGGWTLYPPLSLQTGDALPMAIFDGRVLDHGRDQHHRDHPEHARTGHDAATHAAVRMDLADHRLSADRGHAGFGRRRHHAADRSLLRHQLL